MMSQQERRRLGLLSTLHSLINISLSNKSIGLWEVCFYFRGRTLFPLCCGCLSPHFNSTLCICQCLLIPPIPIPIFSHAISLFYLFNLLPQMLCLPIAFFRFQANFVERFHNSIGGFFFKVSANVPLDNLIIIKITIFFPIVNCKNRLVL